MLESKNKLQEIYEIVKESLLNDPEVKSKWNDLVHITSVVDFLNSFSILYWFTKKVALAVEYVQAELGTISKEEKIDLAAKLLDDIIVFEGWATVFEPFDGFAFKLIISAAVNALNEKFGKDWFGGSVEPAGCRNSLGEATIESLNNSLGVK